MTSTTLFHQKKWLILMVGLFFAPKWSKQVPFCGMDHKKSIFLPTSDTLSVGGCRGQLMLVFWKLIDETQISKPLEGTRHYNCTKLLITQSHLICPFPYDTPCMSNTLSSKSIQTEQSLVLSFLGNERRKKKCFTPKGPHITWISFLR